MDDLSALAQWEHAMTRLRALFDQHGSEAYQQVANYSRRYQGRRAEMVFDVVASRRRDSDLPVTEAFVRTPAASSLRALAEQGPGTNSLRHHLRPGERRGSSFMGYGLRSGEGRTIQAVASGLVRFAAERDLNDDDATRAWAASAAPYECTPKLEPYVGLVKGIGPVHFASMRMLSGADALRPNSRVRTSLNRLGFQVPSDEQSILIVAHAAAAKLGVSRLVLDQLLWWEVTEEPLRPPPSDLVGRQADPPGPGSTDLVSPAMTHLERPRLRF